MAALFARYRDPLPEGDGILDPMSSLVSHLPADRAYAEGSTTTRNEYESATSPPSDH